ncbi:MAG TPA: hypothetical protein VMV76_04900 [Dehalococcoidia bacterium]|nr:hypothetical protein [Dehalococcoidia bacterium]
MITNQGSKKLEMEGKRLHDEVMILKTAIEEAIREGQKSMDDLNDIPGSGLVSNKDFDLTCVNAGSGVIGWVDDF